MKKISLLFFIALFCIPSFVFSQLSNTNYYTIYGGLSVPAGETRYKSSFNAGFSWERSLSKLTAMGFEVNYSNAILDPDNIYLAVIGAKTSEDGSYKTTGVTGFFKIQNAEAVNKSVQPFAKLGIGASLIIKEHNSYYSGYVPSTFVTTNSIGFLLAPSVGMNFMTKGKNKIMFELQYRMNKSSSVDVRTILINAGYSFKL